jgi:3-mercaptopyruvate sulfurtransferase SseA
LPRDALLASDWYAARLKAKQQVDQALWSRHVDYLQRFLKKASHADEAVRLGIRDRLAPARAAAKRVESPEYLDELRGTLGVEPIERYMEV